VEVLDATAATAGRDLMVPRVFVVTLEPTALTVPMGVRAPLAPRDMLDTTDTTEFPARRDPLDVMVSLVFPVHLVLVERWDAMVFLVRMAALVTLDRWDGVATRALRAPRDLLAPMVAPVLMALMV